MNFVDTYRDLRKIKKYSLRERVRHSVLQPLSFFNSMMSDEDRLFNAPRIQFLYIHHVFKDEELALEKLILQLSRNHHFISHSEAVKRILTGDIDRPYISISSDDGLKNNMAAASILDRYGIKGCFFICPKIIDEKDENKIRLFSQDQLHFPPVEFMTWRDVELLLSNGHEIGGHTMSHANLAKVNEAELQDEIGICYNQIVEKCSEAYHFAFPYGRFFHFNEQAKKIVFKTGFISCSSAERGCHIISKNDPKILPEDLLIRRDHVVLDWPLNQILYFMARNVKTAHFSKNFFPYHARINTNE